MFHVELYKFRRTTKNKIFKKKHGIDIRVFLFVTKRYKTDVIILNIIQQ